jgi:hypothetical protein
VPQVTLAHGGGLAADGCHNDRQRGGRHCHRGGAASAAPQRSLAALASPSRSRSGGGAYANCTAARAAGAAPVRIGRAGYGPHLDRDGDGVGCE